MYLKGWKQGGVMSKRNKNSVVVLAKLFAGAVVEGKVCFEQDRLTMMKIRAMELYAAGLDSEADRVFKAYVEEYLGPLDAAGLNAC
jgi:hypothetical protein